MTKALEPGPYRTIRTPSGDTCPWYIIPFDKKGRCKGPLTRDHLLNTLKSGNFTHVYVFSHGWNNDWKTAVERYEHFLTGFMNMGREHELEVADPYRPLLLGIIWPSTSLVLPWEKPPQFAGASEPADRMDALVDDERRCVDDLTDDIADDQLEHFYGLVQKRPALNADEAMELARLLAPLLGTSGDEISDDGEVTPEELLECWSATAPRPSDEQEDDLEEFGTVATAGTGPQAAGFLSALDPRHALRMATVWRMKDRAGTVGAHGVGSLLRDALADTDAGFHLIGHSYGCKVVLSAVCHKPLPRPVTSMLLLQPAVSYLCFAEDVDGNGRPGGYRVAFERVSQPILSTFSKHDFALTKVFPLAVRRKSDLGEQRIAAVPPSRYAALGGYGPGGCGAKAEIVPMGDIGQRYEFNNPSVEVVGVNGDAAIDGHGDISNKGTWWALYNQVSS